MRCILNFRMSPLLSSYGMHLARSRSSAIKRSILRKGIRRTRQLYFGFIGTIHGLFAQVKALVRRLPRRLRAQSSAFCLLVGRNTVSCATCVVRLDPQRWGRAVVPAQSVRSWSPLRFASTTKLSIPLPIYVIGQNRYFNRASTMLFGRLIRLRRVKMLVEMCRRVLSTRISS